MSQDFSGQNLRGHSFIGLDLSGANFAYAKIQGAKFNRAMLKGANFSYCEMGLSRLSLLIWIIPCLLCSLLLGGLGFPLGIILPIAFIPSLTQTQMIGPEIAVSLVIAMLCVFTTVRKFSIGCLAGLITVGSVTLIAAVIGLIAKSDNLLTFQVGIFSGITLLVAIILAIIIAILVEIASLNGVFLGILTAAILLIAFPFNVALSTGLQLAASVTKPSNLGVILTIASCVILMIGVVGLGIYMAMRGLQGDRRYLWVAKSALLFVKGTSFQEADLTDANFTEASLKCANFHKANLTSTNFDRVRNFNLAQFDKIQK